MWSSPKAVAGKGCGGVGEGRKRVRAGPPVDGRRRPRPVEGERETLGMRPRPGGRLPVGEALGDIESEVGHLTALVDDLLMLARTDSGVVDMEHVPLDLADVAAEAAGALTPVAGQRGVTVVVDPLPAVVEGDPLRLRQLVTILVNNAVAHTPAGGTVLVRVRPGEREVTLEVLDEGPGIREEDLDKVFERFWRADDAPAGGTGLGLSIARWIVEHHGGSISAGNRPEGGARFEARLPVSPPTAAGRDWRAGERPPDPAAQG